MHVRGACDCTPCSPHNRNAKFRPQCRAQPSSLHCATHLLAEVQTFERAVRACDGAQTLPITAAPSDTHYLLILHVCTLVSTGFVLEACGGQAGFWKQP